MQYYHIYLIFAQLIETAPGSDCLLTVAVQLIRINRQHQYRINTPEPDGISGNT
jgi:hypothetical protein